MCTCSQCGWSLYFGSDTSSVWISNCFRIKRITCGCCPLPLGYCQWRKGSHGSGSNGQQGILSVPNPNGPAALNQHSNAAQSHRFSRTLPPSTTVLFLLHFSLNWEDARVFNTAFGVWVWVGYSGLTGFGFTMPKPWQPRWLRGILLRWWRGLSSALSLRPGADGRFTLTSFLNMRQHLAKRSTGRRPILENPTQNTHRSQRTTRFFTSNFVPS